MRRRTVVLAALAAGGLVLLTAGRTWVTATGLSGGIAGKFVEPCGLVAWGWRLGDVELTSAFRPDRPEDRDRLLAALQTIIDPAPADPAGRAGEGDPR